MLCHRMSFRFPSFLISSTRKMSSITPTEKAFMAAPHFAVVGASKDTSKFGTRVCTSSLKARGLYLFLPMIRFSSGTKPAPTMSSPFIL